MGNASFLEDFARRVVGLQTSLLFRWLNLQNVMNHSLCYFTMQVQSGYFLKKIKKFKVGVRAQEEINSM